MRTDQHDTNIRSISMLRDRDLLKTLWWKNIIGDEVVMEPKVRYGPLGADAAGGLSVQGSWACGMSTEHLRTDFHTTEILLQQRFLPSHLFFYSDGLTRVHQASPIPPTTPPPLFRPLSSLLRRLQQPGPNIHNHDIPQHLIFRPQCQPRGDHHLRLTSIHKSLRTAQKPSDR